MRSAERRQQIISIYSPHFPTSPLPHFPTSPLPPFPISPLKIMRTNWRIGSLLGIPLYIDSSWFLILAFVTLINAT
ncbi:MAG: hypothetical protein PX637_15305, partial [Microcystis sp. M53601_WE4]|nr:hypothetical protein [Microcystis sp. M53601_WE4]